MARKEVVALLIQISKLYIKYKVVKMPLLPVIFDHILLRVHKIEGQVPSAYYSFLQMKYQLKTAEKISVENSAEKCSPAKINLLR